MTGSNFTINVCLILLRNLLLCISLVEWIKKYIFNFKSFQWQAEICKCFARYAKTIDFSWNNNIFQQSLQSVFKYNTWMLGNCYLLLAYCWFGVADRAHSHCTVLNCTFKNFIFDGSSVWPHHWLVFGARSFGLTVGLVILFCFVGIM